MNKRENCYCASMEVKKEFLMTKKTKVSNVKPIVEEVPCVYPSTEEIRIICNNALEEEKEAITRAILYLKDH